MLILKNWKILLSITTTEYYRSKKSVLRFLIRSAYGERRIARSYSALSNGKLSKAKVYLIYAVLQIPLCPQLSVNWFDQTLDVPTSRL